jgi:hypothetical protein
MEAHPYPEISGDPYKADGFLFERDRLLYRPGEELALAKRV